MRKFNINVPIVKIDEEQRMVYGYATVEKIDSQCELVDYDASKKAFGEWIGNIREQHDDKKAVGKAIDIRFDDEARGVWLGAHISESDDGENTWTKIKEGVLTGYSIGGMINAVKDEVVKAGEMAGETIRRIIDYDLGEVSVVDSPALGKDAQFALVKSKDGQLRTTGVLDSTTKMASAPWWMKKYADRYDIANANAVLGYNNSSKENNMSDVKKSIWTADWLVDLACSLHSYIQSKQYEGEDTAELDKALETIKAAIVEEINEPSKDLTVAVEMATKVVDIKKGENMSSKDIKKEEVEAIEEVTEDEKVEATETEEVTEDEKTEETAAEDTETESADESEEEVAESTKTKDISKATKQTELSKLADTVVDLRKEVAKTATLSKKVDELADQVSELSKAAAPTKAKAEYAVVEKAEDSTVDPEFAEMEKQAKAYQADPKLGTAQERSAFVTKYMVAKRHQKTVN